MQKLTREDRILTVAVYVLLSTVLLCVAYPLYFVVIASISDPVLVSTGRVWLYPRGASLEGYGRILNHQQIMTGYRNSVLYTVVGTCINLVFTLTAAYALSRRDLVGRNTIMMVFAFTMFFSGGLIPLFLLVRGLGLYDTFAAMVLPTALSVWNLIIARTYFQSTIPDELLDSAKMDGCSDVRFFLQVVLPVSSAIVAVLMVFYAVAHWNAFFNALIFLRSRSKYPLQLVLRDILLQHQFGEDMQVEDSSALMQQMLAESIKYGVVIVASVPVLAIYPLVQKHYVRGIMVGAIKG